MYDPYDNLLGVATDNSGQTGITEEYTYDAWNRLVRVERDSGGASPDECEYEYNGLNWRTKERRVRGTASGAGAHTTRHTFYSLQWQQMLEVVEVSGGASSPTMRYEHQFWGLRGVDDAVLRRIDADGDGAYTSPCDRESMRPVSPESTPPSPVTSPR